MLRACDLGRHILETRKARFAVSSTPDDWASQWRAGDVVLGVDQRGLRKARHLYAVVTLREGKASFPGWCFRVSRRRCSPKLRE